MTKICIKEIDGFIVKEYEKSNIYIIENILDDEFCKDVIKLIETVPLKKMIHEHSQNVECFIAYTPNLLKNNDSYIISTDKPYPKLTYHNLNGLLQSELKNYINKINEKVKLIGKIMNQIQPLIHFEYNTGYNLRKIYGRTRVHCDQLINVHKTDITSINNNLPECINMIRNTSMIFALNDDYDGGIFRFPYHDITFKMNKGSVLIFPPYWTHPHEVSALLNNTYRYTINTWTCENIQSC